MFFETCAFGHQLEGKNIAVEVLHVLGERFPKESDLAWRSCSPSPPATRVSMDKGS